LPKQKEHILKFTPRLQDTYLQAIRDGYGLTTSAHKVGISPRTIHDFRKRNPDFQSRIDDAEVESCAPIEDKLRELCLKGNLLAIMYFLGNRSGGRWVDVRKHEPKQQPILDNKTQQRLLENPEKLQQQWIDNSNNGKIENYENNTSGQTSSCPS
jgi:hypothetical protein